MEFRCKLGQKEKNGVCSFEKRIIHVVGLEGKNDLSPIFQLFFSKTFGDFGIRQVIFFHIHVEFYDLNMCRLEDIDENVPGYGNHN